MEMQGNATEIDERNLLQLDALLSHGYGLSPQLVMRSKGLSIEAKALYGYLSSFAGAGDTAFPSTSRILEELDISKNRFYKIRKELISWGFISIVFVYLLGCVADKKSIRVTHIICSPNLIHQFISRAAIRQATVRPYLVDAVGLKPASTIVLDILENPVLVLETVDSFLQGFVNVEAPRPASLLRKTAVALVQLGRNPHRSDCGSHNAPPML